MNIKQTSLFDINHDNKLAGTDSKEDINKLCKTCINQKECSQSSKVMILRCPNYLKTERIK